MWQRWVSRSKAAPVANRLTVSHGQAVTRWIAALKGYDPVRVLVIVREPSRFTAAQSHSRDDVLRA
jgi:hypothetical protein